MVSDRVAPPADNFIELDELKSQISREGGKAVPPAFAATLDSARPAA